MHCLVVIAHPAPESLCGPLMGTAPDVLEAAGHEMIVEDLYGNGCAHALTAEEQARYNARCSEFG